MISVLDRGFVSLVDSMGNDSRIVQAARVSSGKGTKTPKEDEKLLRYLIKNKHTSPFEKVRFEFHVKAPLFVARQWVRHRMVSWNEQSARYSEFPSEFYIPSEESIKGQSKLNKQGSEGAVEKQAKLDFIRDVEFVSSYSYNRYQEALKAGISREMARILLPVNIYTQWYWGIDLHNLLHFLELRNDWHAQPQIQLYAQAIEKLIEPIVPVTFGIWKESRCKNGTTDSHSEIVPSKSY